MDFALAARRSFEASHCARRVAQDVRSASAFLPPIDEVAVSWEVTSMHFQCSNFLLPNRLHVFG